MIYKIWNEYYVYIDGRIYNLQKDINVKQSFIMPYGYKKVWIGKNINKVLPVHKIVWEAFNGKIPAKHKVYHIDRDPSNNHLDNLALAKYGESPIKGNHIRKAIKCSNIETGEVQTFESIKEAGEVLNIIPQSIVDNLKGRTKKCKRKYVFTYDEKSETFD